MKQLKKYQIFLMATIACTGMLATSSANAAPTAIDPFTAATLLNSFRNGLQQRLVPPGEAALFDKIRIMANDINGLYTNVGNDPVAAQITIKANIQNRVDQVAQIATAYYGQNSNRIIMAQNLYVLMTYDALNRYNPKFLWSKLGIFVANMVRLGFAEAFTLQNSINTITTNNPAAANLGIGGISLNTIANIAGTASQDLIQGQLGVVEDIGTLDLLDARFGAQALTTISTLTPEARQGFVYLAQAEAALANGQQSTYQSAYTNAAIQFGIHEQKYLLQPMWNQPVMTTFSNVNSIMLNFSAGLIGLQSPNIYVGTNQLAPYIGPYLSIQAPAGATNVAQLNARVAIATNGFQTIAQWMQQPTNAFFINQSQTNLGTANGIYQPAGF